MKYYRRPIKKTRNFFDWLPFYIRQYSFILVYSLCVYICWLGTIIIRYDAIIIFSFSISRALIMMCVTLCHTIKVSFINWPIVPKEKHLMVTIGHRKTIFLSVNNANKQYRNLYIIRSIVKHIMCRDKNI